MDCGRAELAGEIVVFAVFEYADDTLASALAQSPLSEAEAREVLDASVAALGYLQAQGLAHPSLAPDHVLAVGEAIMLSTDALREAAADAPFTGELCALWYKISPSTPERSADILAQALGGDPQPGTTPAAPPAPAAAMPLAPMPLIDDGTPPPPKRFPKWPWVGAAAVVLLILGLNLRRAPEAPAQPDPVPASAPVVSAPAVPKAGPGAEAMPKPAPKPVSKPAQRGNEMWRVIAFTYRTQDAAARKAEQVKQRHPDFAAAVFSPQDKRGYFLVSLGGRMSRDDAVRLQEKARGERLASDIYVKKFLN